MVCVCVFAELAVECLTSANKLVEHASCQVIPITNVDDKQHNVAVYMYIHLLLL